MTTAYIQETIFGIQAYDEQGNQITQSLYSNNPKLIARYINNLQEGKITPHLKEVMETLTNNHYTKLITTNQLLKDTIKNETSLEAGYQEFSKYGETIQENIVQLLIDNGFIESEAEYGEFTHRVTTQITRNNVHSALSEREALLIPTVQLLGDMDAVLNSLSSRMREWYGVHFPEMGRRVREHKDYAKIIAKFGDKENITLKGLQELSLKKKDAERIENAVQDSMGAYLDEEDVEKIQHFAQKNIDLYNYRDELSEYISSLTKEIAPNIAYLAGPILGAKLIEKAGGLKRMGMLPASTIQLLGAEKAMFRALKTNARPPKHGLIFQHPYVHGAPRNKRGSKARGLAAKIAIAARADLFSGNFIAEDLLKQLSPD